MHWQDLQATTANPILDTLEALPNQPEENFGEDQEDPPRVDESEQSVSTIQSPLQQ